MSAIRLQYKSLFPTTAQQRYYVLWLVSSLPRNHRRDTSTPS